MSTTSSYTITHPTYKEPHECREARVLRELRRFINENEAELDQTTAQKLHKDINVRMLNIMDRLRATP